MSIKWMSPKKVTYKGITNTESDLPDRSQFLRDYGSIIYKSQFRRQSYKTQVFLNPEFDFPRTRLTHCIEVEQIGRQLSRFFVSKLQGKFNNLHENFSQDFEDLVAASCLAHDIGQAPFGHKGEDVLNMLMKENISDQQNHFEANKQNIRLLLGSIVRQPYGVSCALLDSIIKYKANSFQEKANKYPGYYSYEKDQANRVFEENGTGRFRHPACYIMEAADDIAYMSGDLQDGLKMGLISKNKAKELLVDKVSIYNSSYQPESNNWDSILEESFEKKDYSKPLTYLLRGLLKVTCDNLEDFINQIDGEQDINELPELMNNYFEGKNCKLNVLYADSSKPFKTVKDELYNKCILKDPEIARNEILAKKIIEDLWKIASDQLLDTEYEKSDLFKIMPKHVQNHIRSAQEDQSFDSQKYQIIADYISGMTDRYAISMWQKIFDPTTLKY